MSTFPNPFNTPATTVPEPKEHRVPWGRKAFPKDGSGVTLKVAPGDRISFKSIDNEPHNVAEALLESDDNEACRYRWVRNQKPCLNCNFQGRRKFEETLTIDKEGTHHFVCPLNDNHEVMRMTVMATRDPTLNQAFEQARAQQTPVRSPVPAATPAATPSTGLGGMLSGMNPFGAAGLNLSRMNPFGAAQAPSGLGGSGSGLNLSGLNPFSMFGSTQGSGFNPFSPSFVIGPLGPVVETGSSVIQPGQQISGQPVGVSQQISGQPVGVSQQISGQPFGVQQQGSGPQNFFNNLRSQFGFPNQPQQATTALPRPPGPNDEVTSILQGI
jgi:plastocyanin